MNRIRVNECRVAVVILNWNGAEMMHRFLPSVIEGCGKEGKVVVADNGSNDDSRDMLHKEFPNVEVIELDRNYGFAEGYNKALDLVEAEFYLLLNSDVECETGWLSPLLSYMDSHADIAVCAPKLLSQTEKGMFEYAGAAGGFIDAYGYPFCRGRVMSFLEADHGQYDEPQRVFWASGAAMMVRSTDWHEAGGLDGRFFAHMEEIDFCWRMRSRGRGVACVPTSRVFHVGGGTLAQGNPRKTFLNFRNNLLMLYKNLPESTLSRTMRVRWWLDYLAALKFLLSGSWQECKAVAKARKEFKRIRPDFETDRKVNLRKATTNFIPEQLHKSLLIEYYVKGKRRFSEIDF